MKMFAAGCDISTSWYIHHVTPVKRDRDWSPGTSAATKAAAPQWIAAFLSMPLYGGSAGGRKPGRFAQAGVR